MSQSLTLFVGTFTTLLAIINPLEVMPVYLQFLQGHARSAYVEVAFKACAYALALLFFFLIFGTLLLKIFDVPLDMVRIVGGIILMKIGFSLFDPPAKAPSGGPDASVDKLDDIAFVPLAMPLMFGPGAIATVLGMASQVREPFQHLPALAAIAAAIVLTMAVTYLVLVFSPAIINRIGPRGIDAATRIVGFFVAAIGMTLIFQGVTEAARPFLNTPHA